MNGYGASGAVATGIGQIAYTGVNAMGMSILAAALLVAGLILVRLTAVRRSVKHHGGRR